MKIGDWVSYKYKNGQGEGYLLGEMSYSSPKGRVILIGTERHLGMPIAAGHCQTAIGGHYETALILRKLYTDTLGEHHLKPL